MGPRSRTRCESGWPGSQMAAHGGTGVTRDHARAPVGGWCPLLHRRARSRQADGSPRGCWHRAGGDAIPPPIPPLHRYRRFECTAGAALLLLPLAAALVIGGVAIAEAQTKSQTESGKKTAALSRGDKIAKAPAAADGRPDGAGAGGRQCRDRTGCASSGSIRTRTASPLSRSWCAAKRRKPSANAAPRSWIPGWSRLRRASSGRFPASGSRS